MENLHIIELKYLGATNTRGSRVKLTSKRFNESKTIAYNYKLNHIEDMAVEYLESKGFDIIGTAESYVITKTFESIK